MADTHEILKRRAEELRVLAERTPALFGLEDEDDVYKAAGEILADDLKYVSAIFAVRDEKCVLKYVTVSDEKRAEGRKITGLEPGIITVAYDREFFARFSEKPVYQDDLWGFAEEFLGLLYRSHPELSGAPGQDLPGLVKTIAERLFPDISKNVIVSPMKNGAEISGYVVVFGDELLRDDIPTIQHFSQIASAAAQHTTTRLAMKKSLAALAESEERFRSLFELSPDAIVLIGIDGKNMDVNPAAEAMSGYSREEIRGTGLGELNLLAEEDRFELAGMVNDVLNGRDPGRLESNVSYKGGKTGWAELKVSVMKSEGKITGIQIISRDITERKRAEEQLKKLSQQIIYMQEEHSGRLARELHDEVGQQITAMSLGLELLRERGEDTAQIDEMSRIVEGLSIRIRRVCEGLRPMLLDDMGLESALQALVWEFMQRRKIEVEAAIEPVGEVSPDVSIEVYRILQEALTNVARHSGARKVYVGLRRSESDIILEVRDDGRGFAEEEAPRRGFGMTGMKERAELCGGRLEVRSAPGEGTHVVLGVPIK